MAEQVVGGQRCKLHALTRIMARSQTAGQAMGMVAPQRPKKYCENESGRRGRWRHAAPADVWMNGYRAPLRPLVPGEMHVQQQ